MFEARVPTRRKRDQLIQLARGGLLIQPGSNALQPRFAIVLDRKEYRNPRRYLAFALGFFAFLPFDFSAGIPRWRAYLAMNSSVISRARESGRWLCGDFIR